MRALLLIIIAISVGCASSNVNVMRYTNNVYTRTSPEHVKVFRTLNNDRPYIELAEVSSRIKSSSQETVIADLREKAAELGADALVLVGERSLGSNILNIGNGVSIAKARREICAIAIKYE